MSLNMVSIVGLANVIVSASVYDMLNNLTQRNLSTTTSPAIGSISAARRGHRHPLQIAARSNRMLVDGAEKHLADSDSSSVTRLQRR